jgi:GTP-binding protein Era
MSERTIGYRAGFVGLIGLPNSGKSTVMNSLVGEKVSIVTAKPQTTRRRVLGVISESGLQAIFVDAPGLVRAKSGLNLFLRDEAHDVIAQSDVLVAVLNLDAESFESLDDVVRLARESGKPWIALIHKTDLPELHRPRILRDKLADAGAAAIVQGSARAGGEALREILLAEVRGLLPAADGPLYDQDLYTLSNTRDLCAEIIREKCFEHLHQEVPFGLAVKILKFDEDSGPVIKLFAEILVAKDNHRPIVIGKGGQVLKVIGTEARKDIETLNERKVYLDLRVCAKPDWQKNPGVMKELGYVLAKA